jgi:hypothetical protein
VLHDPQVSGGPGELAGCQWFSSPIPATDGRHLDWALEHRKTLVPAQRRPMDDWNASARAPAVALPGTPNHPGSVTARDTAGSFMEDTRPSFILLCVGPGRLGSCQSGSRAPKSISRPLRAPVEW